MPYLFDHLDSIKETLSSPPLGLISDIDGTISEIASSPAEARVSPACRHYLSLLSRQLELVVAISGRPVAEAREMLGIDEVVYFGNHGLEQWKDGVVELREEVRAYPTIISAALAELAPLLVIEGVAFDNKGVTASIHYRRCRNRDAARKAILTAVASSHSVKKLRVTPGRMVVDLRPPVEWNKGSVILELVRRYHLRGAIYLGDDLTDVDAFRAMHANPPNLAFNGIAIAVIDEETLPGVEEEADFTLRKVKDVERFFKWLTRALAEEDWLGPQAGGTATW